MNITIQEVSPQLAQVKELFRLLDEHNLSHCPPEICNLTQPDEIENTNSTLIGIVLDDKVIGMGGLKYYPAYAEVTRMYVRKEYRGRGLAINLLNELEKVALNKGVKCLKLETSENFKSAMILYRKMGFQACEPFGEYIEKPFNTYLQKHLFKEKD